MDDDLPITDQEIQDIRDEMDRSEAEMRAEFEWLQINHPFNYSEETWVMYEHWHGKWTDAVYDRDPDDPSPTDVEKVTAHAARAIYTNLLNDHKISKAMESIDEIRKRQEKEIEQILENQYRVWKDLQKQYGGKIPDDVADNYKDASRKATMALDSQHKEERASIPFYGKVLETESALSDEVRGVIDTIEMQHQMNATQDEMERLIKEAREREAKQKLKR